MSKVRSFREDPLWWEKLITALAYLILGWMVVKQPEIDMGGLLSLFLLLGILIWVFIIRRRDVKYFIRYHVVQALLLNIVVATLLWLLVAFLGLLLSIPGIKILGGIIANLLFQPFPVAGVFDASAKDILLMALTIIMAGYALLGRYTELPYITDGSRHWL